MESGTMITTSCYLKSTTSLVLPPTLTVPRLSGIALAELMMATGAQAHPGMIATIPMERCSFFTGHVE